MKMMINAVPLENIGAGLADRLQACSHLELVNIPIQDSTIDTARAAIEWADRVGADVLLFVSKRFRPEAYDFSELLARVLQLAEDGISIVALSNGRSRVGSAVDAHLSLTESWHNMDGWIVLRPCFHLLQHIDLAVIEEYYGRVASLTDLFNISSPSKFIWHTHVRDILSERQIQVIIPFRNVARYISDCITSIEAQAYTNYRVIFVDDCSDDHSLAHIPAKDNYLIIRNSQRKYALVNILDTLLQEEFEKDDIICLLDGDDMLAHPYVFRILNNCYSTTKTWITYGSYRTFGSLVTVGGRYTASEFRQLRTAIWKGSHLKTFQYSLFEAYYDQDPGMQHMKTNTGDFLKMPYDMAIMFPLLELAGYRRATHIPMPIYLYRTHDNNDYVSNNADQISGEREIRSKKSFRKIASRPIIYAE